MKSGTHFVGMTVVGIGAFVVLGAIVFLLTSNEHAPVVTGVTAVAANLSYQLFRLVGDA
jgi:hypothetical protein